MLVVAMYLSKLLSVFDLVGGWILGGIISNWHEGLTMKEKNIG